MSDKKCLQIQKILLDNEVREQIVKDPSDFAQSMKNLFVQSSFSSLPVFKIFMEAAQEVRHHPQIETLCTDILCSNIMAGSTRSSQSWSLLLRDLQQQGGLRHRKPLDTAMAQDHLQATEDLVQLIDPLLLRQWLGSLPRSIARRGNASLAYARMVVKALDTKSLLNESIAVPSVARRPRM